MENIVFNSKWFEKHQRKLLWLLNTPIIKHWFRWVMRIRSFDCRKDVTIVEITPNSFTMVNRFLEDGNPELTTDFRTHDKYSKRLYFAFKPFWYLLHAFDWALMDRVEALTKLSFGFSTLTQYPCSIGTDNPVNGRVKRFNVSENWATIKAGAGNGCGYDYNHEFDAFLYLQADTTGQDNKWTTLQRSIFCFDTSALTIDATISAAVMSLYGYSKSDTSSNTPKIDIYTSTPANTNILVNADYGQIGTTSQTGSSITYDNWSITQYNDFTFNATGRGNISKTGISKFGAREVKYDVGASTPTWSADKYSNIRGYMATTTGNTKSPKLVITYTLPAVGPANLKSYNTNLKANIKTINTNAIANVKTLNTNA